MRSGNPVAINISLQRFAVAVRDYTGLFAITFTLPKQIFFAAANGLEGIVSKILQRAVCNACYTSYNTRPLDVKKWKTWDLPILKDISFVMVLTTLINQKQDYLYTSVCVCV